MSKSESDFKSIDKNILVPLELAMSIHAIMDFGAAVILFIRPTMFQSFAPDFVLEPVLTRIIAGALVAITYCSLLVSQHIEKQIIIFFLTFKIVWSTTVWIGMFISICELIIVKKLSVNILIWIAYYVFIVGSIVWNTFYILVKKKITIPVGIIILALLSIFIVNTLNIMF